MNRSAIAAVALGGFAGTAARFGVGELFPGAWPVATFAINVVGAFLLGLLLEVLVRLGPDTSWRRLLRLGVGTGALGSFTTYSALAVDADLLWRDGRPELAIGYAVGTMLVGLAATALGVVAGSARRRRARR
ncbi:fluoride efflux transporter FluC [Rhodococcus rhodochrous]|uniref:fluoride efflux transporter FluC n=1 Tax=Rhodococcus rhodochrous TaxID=1829 RepID=UPI0027E121DA|nr:CrcB family protein [Rhodococcus rhodochrous]